MIKDFYDLTNAQVSQLMLKTEHTWVEINRYLHSFIFTGRLELVESKFLDRWKYKNEYGSPTAQDAVTFDYGTRTRLCMTEDGQLFIKHTVIDTNDTMSNHQRNVCEFLFKFPDLVECEEEHKIRNLLLTTLYNDLWKQSSRAYEEEQRRLQQLAIDDKFTHRVYDALGLDVF